MAQEGRATVKQSSARQDRKKNEGQDQSLFVIESFHQGQHNAGAEEEEYERVGCVQPALCSPRENEQRNADETAEKMRQFKERNGNDLPDPQHPRGDLGRRSREKEQRTGRKNNERKDPGSNC